MDVVFSIGEEGEKVFKNGMDYVLGFKNRESSIAHESAQFAADLIRDTTTLMVYCSHSQVPLLRVTHLPSTEHGAVVHQVFKPIIYIPINCIGAVNVIEIDL
jgi:hypothetical protein